MNRARRIAAGSAALAIAASLAVAGCGNDDDSSAAATTSAAAESAATVDYNALLITPDDIVLPGDSFDALAPTTAPAAQQGASTLFTNTDGTRRIGIVITVLPDADSAAMAVENMAATLPSAVTVGDVQNVDVGDRGNMIAGDSYEAGKSIVVVVFQQGATATTMQFDGALGDEVPTDWALELARKQADKLATA